MPSTRNGHNEVIRTICKLLHVRKFEVEILLGSFIYGTCLPMSANCAMHNDIQDIASYAELKPFSVVSNLK